MRYEIQGTDRAGNTRCQVMPASYDAKTVLLALAIRQMLWPEKFWALADADEPERVGVQTTAEEEANDAT